MTRYILPMIFVLCTANCYSQPAATFSIPSAFQDSARIVFTLPTSDTVSLRVYDRWGANVRTLFDDSLISAGSHTCYLRGDSLSSSVYYVVFGCSSAGAQKMITKMDPVTTISEVTEENLILFFPNPASGILNISAGGIKTIRIFDNQGQLVTDLHTDAKTIPLDNLAVGSYVTTICGQQCHTGRLQIVK